MISIISFRRHLLPFAFLAMGLLVSVVFLAQAQVPTVPSEGEIAASGIVFPVAELGNCANKTSCKAYCDDSTHMPECIAFAESHGLMNAAEAARARKFATRLQGDGGPGGCRSDRVCRDYCEDITHMDECLAFAESEGIDDRHIKEARRIQTHLRGGGQLPGGCTSKVSCEVYCTSGNLDRMEECVAFAEAAGLDIDHEEGGPKSAVDIRKFIQLARNGETPGGCKNKNECEAYCRGGEHINECIAFGERMGFISSQEAEMARKTGGKGPGGCQGERECRTYCNDPGNQEDCFRFAEEHGLIKGEELKHAKDGFVQLRQGLDHAPADVVACFRTHLGSDVIEKIQSGSFTPGLGVGQKIRACFEKFGGRPDPQEIFNKVPSEVLECARNKFGTEFDGLRSGAVQFTPEKGDVFRACGDQMRLQSGGFFGEEGAHDPNEGPGGPPPGGLSNLLRSAPPGVQACLKENLGGQFEALRNGQPPTDPSLGEKIKSCFQGLRSDGGHEGFPGGSRGGFPGPDGDHDGRPAFIPSDGGLRAPLGVGGFPGAGSTISGSSVGEVMGKIGHLPAPVQECVRTSFSAEGFKQEDVGSHIRECMERVGGDDGARIDPGESFRPEHDEEGIERPEGAEFEGEFDRRVEEGRARIEAEERARIERQILESQGFSPDALQHVSPDGQVLDGGFVPPQDFSQYPDGYQPPADYQEQPPAQQPQEGLLIRIFKSLLGIR
jgi:hypothetical protein